MHRRTSLALLLGLLATSGFAEAQPARLVKDLNIQQQFPLSSREALESEGVGDVFYFVFDDRIHGEELWKTDGTPGGASLVEDICPGACSSFPRALTASNGRLFFAAHDGDLGWRLWKSDGTPQGTSMVTALASMEEFETHLLDAGGTLYFSAADASHGPELWVTDGTAEGTRRVTDIPSGPFSWWPRPMAAGQGLVLFAAEDAAHGYEPWVTDGTKEGTRMLGDLAPGSSRSVFLHSGVQQAVAAPWGGFLFGAASFEGNELWATDGTPQGTSMVKNIKLDGHSDPHGFTAVNGRVVFVAEDSQRGIEPWVSDGTPEGTVLLKDIWPGMDGSYPRELTAVGNQVFFRASEMTLGSELWATDGTPAGTRLVKDIAPGSSAFFSHHRYGFSNLEGRLVFFAYPTLGLWESDGTAAGTRPIAPGDWPSPYSIDMQDGYGIAGGRLFFRSGSWGHEIWATDGSEAGPVQLESFFELSSAFWPQNGKLQPPGNFAAYGDVLLFLGSDGLTAGELWRSDGSGPGTWALKDLTPDGSPSIPHSFLPVNGRMVFRAAGGLGVTDGTPEGTELLPPKGTTAVARLGSEVFALTLDNENPGLWKTDGTLAGTVPAAEISNSDLGLPSELVASGGKLFIKTFLDRLWVSDGTQAGTYLLETGGDNPVNLVDSGGTLFFTAGTNAAGSELWKSNGTPEGTFMVKDIRPGPEGSVPPLFHQPLASLPGGVVLLAADDGVSGVELWKSDGTMAGTVRLLDIQPGAAGSEPRNLTTIGSRVYFSANDGVHGRELWVTNGTPEGTRMVRDVFPGPGSSRPDDFTEVNNHVVFSAFDDVHGREPWRTDGTGTGTWHIHDIAPGPASSSPTEFTVVGDKIFFAANDNVTGVELWVMPRTAVSSTFMDVPANYWAWGFIEALASAGVTTGCAPGLYCPLSQVTRAEMAIFLERGLHGGAYVPPPATGTVFTDVPANYWAAAWIERFAADGITTGCAPSQYCPDAPVSRAEMAVFLLRSKHGAAYTPPPATGTRFTDVPASYWAAAWIEQLAAEGITTGCAPDQYCPDSSVSRDQMAAFLVRTFGLL